MVDFRYPEGEQNVGVRSKERDQDAAKARDQTRLMKRDARIIERLAAGLTIEEIAAREGISARRTRERVSAILAQRAHDSLGDLSRCRSGA